MLEPIDRRLTLEEYLELEARSLEPHEYRNGFAVALAVPSGTYGVIASNLAIGLGSAARASGGLSFAGDAKIVTPAGERLIPDFLVTCDARDREALLGPGEATVRHPWLVIEILSPATAADDMTGKLDAYQTIEDVSHYVVVDSRRRALRAFERLADGKFASSGLLQALEFSRLPGVTFTIEDIYRDTGVRPIEDVPPTV